MLSILIAIIILFLFYLLFLVRPHIKAPHSKALLCDYAHRGLHGGGVPENSLAAFSLAAEQNFGIELDVQLSRDGEVMVFHDYTLKRMTDNSGKLSEFKASELIGLSLSGTDQKIPTLKQVLSLVNGRVPLLIELKGESGNTSLCKKVAELLSEYSGEYCIESFNPLLIRGIRKYLPDSFCGLIYTNVCRDKSKKSILKFAIAAMALNFLCRPNFISYDKEDRNSFPVWLTTRFYRAHRFIWTIDMDKEMSFAKENCEYAIFEKFRNS